MDPAFRAIALGSTLALLDSEEALLLQVTYDAWGNELLASGTGATPYRYVGAYGYYKDSETSLLYLWHRYCDPRVGRFVSRDRVRGGLGSLRFAPTYAYMGSEPTTRTDPVGGLTGGGTIGIGGGYWIGGGVVDLYCCDTANQMHRARFTKFCFVLYGSGIGVSGGGAWLPSRADCPGGYAGLFVECTVSKYIGGGISISPVPPFDTGNVEATVCLSTLVMCQICNYSLVADEVVPGLSPLCWPTHRPPRHPCSPAEMAEIYGDCGDPDRMGWELCANRKAGELGCDWSGIQY